MKLKIFSVYDTKAEFYHPPFFFRTNGEALRVWMDLANDRSNQIGQYPQDFVLFEIGTFDPQTGSVEPCDPANISHGTAIEFQKQNPQGHIIRDVEGAVS